MENQKHIHGEKHTIESDRLLPTDETEILVDNPDDIGELKLRGQVLIRLNEFLEVAHFDDGGNRGTYRLVNKKTGEHGRITPNGLRFGRSLDSDVHDREQTTSRQHGMITVDSYNEMNPSITIENYSKNGTEARWETEDV
jgi:hypothetical protein